MGGWVSVGWVTERPNMNRESWLCLNSGWWVEGGCPERARLAAGPHPGCLVGLSILGYLDSLCLVFLFSGILVLGWWAGG